MTQQEQEIYHELQVSKMKKQINTIGLKNFSLMLTQLVQKDQAQQKQGKLAQLLTTRTTTYPKKS